MFWRADLHFEGNLLWGEQDMQLGALVTKIINEHCAKSPVVVAGVSGGVDSMVLLHTLAQLVVAGDVQQVHVVHVHHGLRAAADADAAFVQAYCTKHDIPCRVEQVKVSPTGIGIEAAAREARFAAFNRVASEVGAAAILLAHHQDDQVETFLLRWLRGTSLHGLGGIRPFSLHSNMVFLRPFLRTKRQELVDYARTNHVPWVTDETNLDMRFTRNYLRQRLIPSLRELQPEIGEITSRLVEDLQVDDSYLQEQAAALCKQMVKHQGAQRIQLTCSVLINAHVSLQRRAIHILLNCFASQGWTHRHIDAVLSLAANANAPSGSIDLGRGLSAWRNYHDLYIGHDMREEPYDDVSAVWHLSESPRFSLATNELIWRFWRLPLASSEDLFQRTRNLWRLYIPHVSSMSIQCCMATSTRVRPLGLGGSKKLQDIFTNAKVPRALRAKWPVFCLGEDVVWVPGIVRTEAHTMVVGETEGWVILAHRSRRLREQLGHSQAASDV